MGRLRELSSAAGASRRGFLVGVAATGGGLTLGVCLTKASADVGDGSFEPDAFIRIAPAGKVTLVMPAVEMGQGTYTSVPMMIAEELDITLDMVVLEHAPPDAARYGNPLFKVQMTGGSTTVRAWWTPLRKAGAAARLMLVETAAEGWGVSAGTCTTKDGRVFHETSGRSLAYGDLVARAARRVPPKDPPLKDPKVFRLIGKSQARLDTPAKVNGTAQYGIDALPKGVKFATLASSPVFGGKVERVDEAAALAVTGVRQVVVLDDLVAVVGDHMWAAMQGLQALAPTWTPGPNAHVEQADIWSALSQAADHPGVVAKSQGDPAGQLAKGKVVEARYELPFLAHAAMEPMNCTVDVRADACEIWVGTQAPVFAQALAAKESGLPVEKVLLHNHLIGGGFGRRLEVDGVGTAVRIARHVKGPVKVVWSREEDIQQERYRPVYHNRMAARLEDGKVTAWSHRVAGPSIMARYLPPAFVGGLDVDAVDGAVEPPYDFPNLHVDYVRHEPQGVTTAFWRGVGPNSNVFSIECFMDRLAHETRQDPVAFRRRMIASHPRARAVLDLAAERAGWTTPLAGRPGYRVGRGMALHWAFGSYLAAVAEVAVAPDGAVSVTRVVVAVDCGMIVNPDGVISQIQGGVIFGLSAVLHGQISIAGGRVEQSNFHDYRVLRIDETPRIDVHLVISGEAPGGIGEPGTVVVQPAVANAVYAATNIQPTRMPIGLAQGSRA